MKHDLIAVCAAARLLPESSREAYLRECCADEADRERVRSLLLEAEEADTFFGDSTEANISLAIHEEDAGYSEKEGDRVGPFILRQRLGEGGFGTVWMAEQKEPISRMVALKMIKAGMDTKEVLERQALAMMNHPHIAKVLDAGATATGRPWFAMELVKGVSMTQFCDDQGLGTRQRLELFGEVCAAINHALQKGVIHRDLKPSNVMVTIHGGKAAVKVIDFGMAKATQGKLTEKTLFTRYGQFIGTPV